MTNLQKFVLLSVREKKFEKNFCRICYLVWFQFLKERFCFLTISVENKGGSYWLILYIVPNFAKTCCFPVIIILDIKCSIFFSIRVFFHERSRITGLQGKGEGISLTPHYQFNQHYRHLDINREITAETSPLRIASSQTQTGNLWLPSTSH